MSQSQIKQTAELIIEEYGALKAPEINFVFRQAKKGKYGHLYSEIDGTIILSFFEKHFQERIEEAEALAERKHTEAKKQSSQLIPVEIVKQTYKTMQDRNYEPPKEEIKINNDEEYQKFRAQYYKRNLD